MCPFLFAYKTRMIKTEHEYLERAMKSYDNPQALTIEEFNKDLNLILTVRKFIVRYVECPDDVNVRKLVNCVVVLYNCFGSTATELLMYKISETDHLGVLVPIIAFINRDYSSIPYTDINNSIVQSLITL